MSAASQKTNMGTFGWGTIMNGIYCLDNTGNITPYTMEKTGMLTNSITTFSCADGINLYIGTSSGLYCMNTETKEISLLENNNSASNLFEEVHINCIYQDTRGLLWIGTRKGMDVYNKKYKKNEFICLPKTDCLMIIYGQSLKIKKKHMGYYRPWRDKHHSDQLTGTFVQISLLSLF